MTLDRSSKYLLAITVVVVAILGFTGVAYGANSAAPGDSLYGLDRVLEKVGVGAGGLEERLAEAGDLMEQGRVEEGLAHAAEALAEEQDDLDGDEDGELTEEELQGREEALLAAAEAVLGTGSEQSLEVRSGVAEKLQWMATTELTGKEFGQAVSALARGESPDGENASSNGEAKGPADKDKTNNGKSKDRQE